MIGLGIEAMGTVSHIPADDVVAACKLHATGKSAI